MRQSSAVRAVPRPMQTSQVQTITGGRVFVVDDDASVRKSLERLLTSVGYKVQTFDSARSFLARPQTPAEGPQCLILDIRMSGVDGLELQRRLRAANWKTPIIVISAHAGEEVRSQALEGGAVDFFVKPFSTEALLAAVERASAGGSPGPPGG